MEVIEDGNIMDRIPILLQRDLEYYQTNQTVLSETICPGVVGGRMDFPRNASFAAVKIVIWLEEEFSIAFNHGSGFFVKTDEDENRDCGVIKTSDPDKFVQLAIKSADALLEHLHVLVQEALDHADLPVLTATLGASALLRNSLSCFVQHLENMGSSERLSMMQSCHRRYVTMSEAVAERVLDLHNRILSLYILQDSGGRPIENSGKTAVHSGTPSVQGWWLYMNGSKKDLWDKVPPRMAQRIYAGMLNETLTILTVRYCQTNTNESTTPLLINDVLNILLCVAELLPSICSKGSDLAGLGVKSQSKDVRDVHAKCNELFNSLVYRGAEIHFIHQAFNKDVKTDHKIMESPSPWFMFVSPKLFGDEMDINIRSCQDLPKPTALGLELIVLLAQPQPSWTLLVKLLMMRDCHLARVLLIRAIRNMSPDNSRWPASGEWYNVEGCRQKCGGVMCTVDGFCRFKKDKNEGEEYARVAGALTYILATVGDKAEFKSTLCYALEISGKEWASCLDKQQIWCDRRPPWYAALLAAVGTTLQFLPGVLVGAVQTGASMYQTMSLCLSCISRVVDCLPRSLFNAATIIENTLPSNITSVSGSVLLQILVTVAYEELLKWAKQEAEKENAVQLMANGEPHKFIRKLKTNLKSVKVVSFGHGTPSTSQSFDFAQGTASSIALAVAEALCSIDEDDKHTREMEEMVSLFRQSHCLSDKFGLEDYPEFAEFFQEGFVPGANAEKHSDAVVLTSQILMTAPGRDSLRVIYNHLQLHSNWIYKNLGINDINDSNVPLTSAPLLYIMFHIGRQQFDQYFRGEWSMPWSKLVAAAKSWSGVEGARTHINRRTDIKICKQGKTSKQLMELYELFKSPNDRPI